MNQGLEQKKRQEELTHWNNIQGGLFNNSLTDKLIGNSPITKMVFETLKKEEERGQKLIIVLLFLIIPFIGQSQTSTTICEGSPWPTLTATCEGGVEPYTVTWTSPTSETYEGEEVELNEEGLWTWVCEDDGATTCSSSGGTHLVKVEETPEDVVINADSVCVNTLQPISATGVPAGYTLSWDFDSGATPATSTSTSTNVSYGTGGAKTITLTITKTPVEGEICSETCEHEFTKVIDIGELTGTITCE